MPPTDPHLIGWDEVSASGPCRLDVGYAIVPLVDERKGAPLMSRITGIRRQLSKALGFVIPPVHVRDDLELPGNAYRISIGGVVVGEDEIFPNELLALDSGAALSPLDGRPCKDPTFNIDALWIARSAQNDAIAAGYTVVDPATVIATHLNHSIARSAEELFGIDDAQALVDNLKHGYPQLAQTLTPQAYTLPRIALLCRALLAERVPLRDFRQIAEALVAVSTVQYSDADLVEAVRQRLGGLIVQTIVPTRMPLPVVTLHPDLEVLLVQGVRANPGAEMPFEPDLARRLIDEMGQVIEPLLLATRSFALVVSPLCRAALARLVRTNFREAAVLSYLELPPNKATEIVATIGAETRRLLPEGDSAAWSQADES